MNCASHGDCRRPKANSNLTKWATFVSFKGTFSQFYCAVAIVALPPFLWNTFEMIHNVCEFHIKCHLQSWASGRGSTNSPSHALNMAIQPKPCWWDDKFYPINQSPWKTTPKFN